jgi:hypothetical protein
MGTSGSYSGGRAGDRLLPPWADGDEYQSAGADQGAADQEDDVAGTAHQARVTSAITDARRHFRQYGSTGRRESLARASRSYLSSMGGPRNAATAARAGRATTRRLAGFLSEVVRSGVPAAFDQVTTESLVGRPVGEVLAVLEDFLAPDGSSLDEAAARAAMSVTLRDLYERYGLEELGIEGLNRMDADGLRSALQLHLANYVYEQMLSVMYDELASEDIDEGELVRKEREIRLYTRETVKLELADVDVLEVDWYRSEGSQLAMRIFEQAYSVWEAVRP